jgi:hypothetical protein
MNILKPYTKKLLKDLDNPDLWEKSFLALKNKEYKFEIFYGGYYPFLRIWKYPQIKFNLIEKYLIARKANKILSLIRKKERQELLKEELPEYFK